MMKKRFLLLTVLLLLFSSSLSLFSVKAESPATKMVRDCANDALLAYQDYYTMFMIMGIGHQRAEGYAQEMALEYYLNCEGLAP